ncbi:ABC transporter substrate-binding protein [Microbaculum marinisediminis]|uniref:ABC transporter substrate-binding protein n=1 Tax=Microbaculum marinisediminis TaxID=2931392 RepID=A0AAW5QY53_9HYPH|nr:ABC transporter substrate-binding protein [Microbaculum sp. A6E488]MCT8971834.1 ABC transporter substrate-binding protein [Microbaculum sp. A6E488]
MTFAHRIASALLVAGTAFSVPASAAAEEVKVGLIFTLSGPAAALGEQGRNGFQLAVDELGGLGGLDVALTVVDDEQKPDIAAGRARELVEREGVDFVVGPIFSNILQAIFRPVTEGGAFLVSPNAGTSNYAGSECHPDFFVTSYQNDQVHEVMGAYAEREGYKSVILMAPNYQAGRDALAGFKNSYRGTVMNELFTPMGHFDFSAELAQVAALRPEAVFAFMPGGMGVNLVRQYEQAGLKEIPFLSAFTVDESTLDAQKSSAKGMLAGANWAPDMDNDASRQFVRAYEERFGAIPGTYAMQAYDAALLIDSAIRSVGGDLSDRDGLREALRKADFESLRGSFSFGENHYPIQDFYLTGVVQREDGRFHTSIVERIFDDYQDRYVGECSMQ